MPASSSWRPYTFHSTCKARQRAQLVSRHEWQDRRQNTNAGSSLNVAQGCRARLRVYMPMTGGGYKGEFEQAQARRSIDA